VGWGRHVELAFGVSGYESLNDVAESVRQQVEQLAKELVEAARAPGGHDTEPLIIDGTPVTIPRPPLAYRTSVCDLRS